MAAATGVLSRSELRRFARSQARCAMLKQRVENLADYLSVISSLITGTDQFWFRGHEDAGWELTPTALRYKRQNDRTRALGLVAGFKRVAEIKLTRPPLANEELKWVQLARHYGLPTRLLDWTESATIALYFAPLNSSVDGMVFILNPVDLNRMSYPKNPRIFSAQSDEKIIATYLKLGARESARGPGTIAINPVWNSERLMLQKGVFTLHGSRFQLDGRQAPSLVGLPILKECKVRMLFELGRVGVDEMSIFPELEHSCNFLIEKANLVPEK
jgi:hypothetical protein